jgi:hypothetical protein
MNWLFIKALFLEAISVLIFFVHSTTPVFGKDQHHSTDTIQFKSERVSQTDSIIVNGDIKKVFPLFGAFEERKWDPGWRPALVYKDRDTTEEGTTFKTASHGFGEPDYIWRINKYEPQNALIQYLVTCPNRYWTITVKCRKIAGDKTQATVTYTFIGLNPMGNHLDKHSLARLFEHHLKDWEQAINSFLSKSKPTKNN